MRPRKEPSDAEKAKAAQLAERSGIPVPVALLVVRGEKNLNDVLNEMFAVQKRDRLVRDGLDPSLAGQVARDRLPLDRAKRIQTVTGLQQASFRSDTLRHFDRDVPIVLDLFGQGRVRGSLIENERYDVLFHADGAAEPVQLKKHDIKLYFRADQEADVLPNLGMDADVAALGLTSSAERADRFRIEDAFVFDWVGKKRTVRFLFRDGTTLTGQPVRIARFEIELDVGKGVRVCLLGHALLKDRPFQVV